MKPVFLLFCFLLFFCSYATGQSNRVDSSLNNSSTVNAASSKLLKSIEEHKSSEEIARNYSGLAQALSKAGNFARAEVYMEKAVQLEQSGKRRAYLPEYLRELAKLQELQNKYTAAAENFEKAAAASTDNAQKQLNQNDAARMKYKSSPQVELQYLNQNNVILNNNSGNNTEKLQNYQQLATTNIALNQNEAAMENYKDALTTVDSASEKFIQIKSDMVNLMAGSNNLESAIALQKEVVLDAQNNSNVTTQVTQMRNLSALYFQMDSADAGLKFLESSYELAVAKGNLKEAKESLTALAAYYEKNKDNKRALALYNDFLAELELLIAKDSSLVDKTRFLINEGKISELEQQQVLKDELIVRTNKSNYILIGSVVLLSVLLLLIVKALFSIRKKSKQIALQSLRREMNPHFLFNSLNSVNQFIANNNEREANKYLTSYSGLMRNIMENSNKDYVTLSNEIDQLKKYLELEKLRFSDKFEYTIEVDPSLDAETTLVPNMILQPNLENAIWHGLRYRESSGFLRLKFSKSGKRMMATIEDNGIGLTESKKIKTKNQKLHESLGLKNVQERIRLLNEIYRSDIRFDISEKTGTESGVLVRIEW